jgi:predicted ATPase
VEAFERVVVGGTSELVLVGGYSGIGKSSVVNELRKALPQGVFIGGKFDQHKRDISYGSLPIFDRSSAARDGRLRHGGKRIDGALS